MTTGRRRRLGVAAALLLALSVLSSAPGAAQVGEGEIRVAYPGEPVVWHPALSSLTPSVDLAALWGLPLYRIDHRGQLRPALVEDARVLPGDEPGPWSVELTIRPGVWSDGDPVVAADVVATIEALLDGPGGGELGPIVGLHAGDEHGLRIDYAVPYARWAHGLASVGSVVPARLVDAEGIGAYRDDVPVSGGRFRLAAHEPGLMAAFDAHPDGPLGAPELGRIEVWFTPSYETALGLLRDHRVDVAAGYVVTSPRSRAARVEGVAADAPLGGTTVALRWREASPAVATRERLHVARDAVDVRDVVDGLLGGESEPATSPLPGVDGPWVSGGPAIGDLGTDVALLLPGPYEVKGVVGRVLQRSLRPAASSVVVVRIEHDDTYSGRVDAALVVRRDTPRPALAAFPTLALDDAGRETVARGDATGSHDDVASGLEILFDAGLERPLFRVAVAHAWRPSVANLRPSAWPGIAFWDAGRWGWTEEGPPRQEPTLP